MTSAAVTARRRTPAGLLWIGMILAVLAALPFLGLSNFFLQQAFPLFFFIALAQSWNILGGYTGYLSLGHAGFVGIGGYAVAIPYFLFGWSPFVTFPLAAVAAGLLALVIGAICFRIRGSYFLIATMLVLFILQTLAVNLRPLTNGANGIDMPLFTSDFTLEGRIWYYCGFVLVILTFCESPISPTIRVLLVPSVTSWIRIKYDVVLLLSCSRIPLLSILHSGKT